MYKYTKCNKCTAVGFLAGLFLSSVYLKYHYNSTMNHIFFGNDDEVTRAAMEKQIDIITKV